MSDITLDDLRAKTHEPSVNGVDFLTCAVTLDELLTVVARSVQPGRLVVETPCGEHGEFDRHWLKPFADKHDPLYHKACSGSRRIVGSSV